jgi:formate dehydrogenase accessory protein FdhE
MARTSKQADPQIQAALKRLDALAERAPDLAEPIAFYRAVLPILREAGAQVTPFALQPETARDKLRVGLSLLVGEDLPLDWDATHVLFLKLCRTAESVGSPAPGKSSGWSLFKRGQPDTLKLIDQARNGDSAHLRVTAAAQIRRAVEKDELDLLAVFGALASGDWRRVELTAVGLKLDPELLRMLAQNSLKPALRAWMQGLKNSIDVDNWQRGQCPYCGSPPVFAEIQGKEGARRLRCAMCGADWPYPRLQCAFCATQDYKHLGYISIEGEEDKYRLQTCEKCRGYLKVVVTFDPTPVDQLAIEDLATLHLDLIANEREFTRVAVQ